MATVNVNDMQRTAQFGGTPYGNAIAHQFTLKTTATGAVEGGDSTVAVGLGDIVRFGFLPRGLKLLDALVIVSTGWTAAVTGKIGWLYADGVDRTDVPQDDDYFIVAGGILNAQGRLRANNLTVFPVTLPKEAYLVITTAGAANAKVSRLDFILDCEDRGPLE